MSQDPRDRRLRQLAAAGHAHLATVRPDGRPHIVPITFAVDGGRLVTAIDQKPKRTRAVQRLDNIRANPEVSVLADRYDDDWSRLWWVRADGTAAIVEDGPSHAAAVAALRRRYPAYADDPPRGPAIIVDIHRVTGWAASGDVWPQPGPA